MALIDIGSAYPRPLPRWWQVISDVQAVGVVALLVLGVWSRSALLVVAIATAWASRRSGRGIALVGATVGLAGCALSAHSWQQVQPRQLGHYTGIALLMTDPAPRGGAVQAVIEIEGQRFEVWARGSPKRRLASRLAGESVWISGTRVAQSGTTARRAALRHVVGRFDAAVVGDTFPGSPFARASNHVRGLLAAGAQVLPQPDAALFSGLVIGDDRFEPPAMIAAFRHAGLSHLTAVSGQNNLM